MTEPNPNEVASPGGKVGARVAKLVVDATVHARQRLAGHTAAVARQVFTDTTNHVSDEIRSVMGPIFAEVAAHPDTPKNLRHLFEQLADARGQAWAWIGGTATGAAMGGGLINLLNNEMSAAILPLIAANPHGILNPSDAARAEAMGLGGPPDWPTEAAKGGIDANRFRALVKLNTPHPTPGQLQDAINRDLIDIDVAHDFMRLNGFTQREADLILKLRGFVLTPQDLSAMWNRSIVDTDTGRRLAAKSGMSHEDFDRLIELGGEPPGPQTLAEAFRRGFIDRARYNRGIVQGPIRNEWFDMLEKLTYSRMSTPDAADAVNQGHLSLGQGEAVAKANGLEPQDFAVLIETAGAPPGLSVATEALNRGIITDAEFDQMYLESRIKNRYLPVIKALRYNLIPLETARIMYRKGVISRAKALAIFQQHGYTHEDAADFAALEDARQNDTTKDLTRAQIMSLYADRAISLTDAVTMLMDIGYSEENARWNIELADLSRIQRYLNAAIGRVHASYVAGRIDSNGASSDLDRLQVPSAQRDDLLTLWDLERATVSRGLTPAQIVKAVKEDFLTYEQGHSRLVGQGYGDDDATVVLAIGGVTPPEA